MEDLQLAVPPLSLAEADDEPVPRLAAKRVGRRGPARAVQQHGPLAALLHYRHDDGRIRIFGAAELQDPLVRSAARDLQYNIHDALKETPDKIRAELQLLWPLTNVRIFEAVFIYSLIFIFLKICFTCFLF